mgnify:FL=1
MHFSSKDGQILHFFKDEKDIIMLKNDQKESINLNKQQQVVLFQFLYTENIRDILNENR